MVSGLSPLTRGTRDERDLLTQPCRFIPAHAGNTSRMPAADPQHAVYPRSRGEHIIRNAHIIEVCGLSPLTRGTRRRVGVVTTEHRFIPAHAGNTSSAHSGIGADSVYPRSRGEHFSCIKLLIKPGGLSPLTRGTRVLRAGAAFL